MIALSSTRSVCQYDAGALSSPEAWDEMELRSSPSSDGLQPTSQWRWVEGLRIGTRWVSALEEDEFSWFGEELHRKMPNIPHAYIQSSSCPSAAGSIFCSWSEGELPWYMFQCS